MVTMIWSSAYQHLRGSLLFCGERGQLRDRPYRRRRCRRIVAALRRIGHDRADRLKMMFDILWLLAQTVGRKKDG